jgi:FkbM family methyltransferase
MRSPRDLAFAAARRILGPFVPTRKKLPFFYWLHRGLGMCGPEFSHLSDFFVSTETAIDIGANQGLFTYVFSRRFQRVYAFEVDEEVASTISNYNPGNITLYPFGLSSTSRTSKFYIPVLKGLALAGWGSFDRDNLAGAEEFIEKDVQVKRLDEFEIPAADFVKVDVEGHEVEVLKGAAATIDRCRPVVLIEVKDKNLETVNSWFEVRNFRRYGVEQLFDPKGKNANYLYIPMELIARLRFKKSRKLRTIPTGDDDA